MGLAVIAAARATGAEPIIAVDISAGKEPLALAAGATQFVPAGDTAARQVRAFTGGRGVDHAFECVGRAETIRSAWSLARRGGSCTILGIGRRDERAEFSAAELVRFARTLRSSIYASSDPDADLPGPAPGGAGRCLRSEPLGDPPGGTRRRARSSGPNATRGGRSHPREVLTAAPSFQGVAETTHQASVVSLWKHQGSLVQTGSRIVEARCRPAAELWKLGVTRTTAGPGLVLCYLDGAGVPCQESHSAA